MAQQATKKDVLVTMAVLAGVAVLLTHIYTTYPYEPPKTTPVAVATTAVVTAPMATYTGPAVPAMPVSPVPVTPTDRLVLPDGRKMTPAKWCTTYAPTFTRLAEQAAQADALRRPKYKNGEQLDNSRRDARADALYAKVTGYDPGPAIADAKASLPYRTKREAALAAPAGAGDNQVNVDMWYAYEDVGRAEARYTQKFDETWLAPDDAADARNMARELLTRAIGTPPTSEPGSGETGLCYVQKPYKSSGGSGSGASGGSAGAGGGCSYSGRPRATWKVWRWGDWSC